MADLLAIAKRVRAEFSDELLTAEQVGRATCRVAEIAGKNYGVLLKPQGHGVPSPVGRISSDIIIDIPDRQEYDIWEASDGKDGVPGPCRPTLQKKPYKVGKCAIVDGQEECSRASMDRVVVVAGHTPTPPEPTPHPPAPPLPLPDPIPQPPLGPAHPYGVHTPLGAEIGEILGTAGSPYVGNARAIGEATAHLLWKVQYEGYSLASARENAMKRSKGEPAD